MEAELPTGLTGTTLVGELKYILLLQEENESSKAFPCLGYMGDSKEIQRSRCLSFSQVPRSLGHLPSSSFQSLPMLVLYYDQHFLVVQVRTWE